MKRVDPPVLASLLSAIAGANWESATTNVFAGGDHIDRHPHPESLRSRSPFHGFGPPALKDLDFNAERLVIGVEAVS